MVYAKQSSASQRRVRYCIQWTPAAYDTVCHQLLQKIPFFRFWIQPAGDHLHKWYPFFTAWELPGYTVLFYHGGRFPERLWFLARTGTDCCQMPYSCLQPGRTFSYGIVWKNDPEIRICFLCLLHYWFLYIIQLYQRTVTGRHSSVWTTSTSGSFLYKTSRTVSYKTMVYQRFKGFCHETVDSHAAIQSASQTVSAHIGSRRHRLKPGCSSRSKPTECKTGRYAPRLCQIPYRYGNDCIMWEKAYPSDWFWMFYSGIDSQ